ncbi:hypothetical protein [uncultured Kordia sp.]|uniref:hypothetical protein n=1 Tax=uncultured Kordia sp. TaxID=507699 RepID=UPI00261E04B0|nr:hypothetical protein [uncultured Kordia sp.]
MKQILTDLSIGVLAGLIILIAQIIIRTIIKVRRRKGQNDSELSALITLGRIMWIGLFGIIIYGFITRPIFSKQQMRDEVAVLKKGQMIFYDIDLRHGSKDVITLEFEVIEGNSVDVRLIPMPPKNTTKLSNEHIPSFSINSAQSGSKSVRVEPGLWSIVINPVYDGTSSITKVDVKTYVSRSRFFQTINQTVPR